ncbi:hypothetical protein Hanom_Chr11g00994771 [Helianthus anomalus]
MSQLSSLSKISEDGPLSDSVKDEPTEEARESEEDEMGLWGMVRLRVLDVSVDERMEARAKIERFISSD